MSEKKLHPMQEHAGALSTAILDVLHVLVSGKDRTRAIDDLRHADVIDRCMGALRRGESPDPECVLPHGEGS